MNKRSFFPGAAFGPTVIATSAVMAIVAAVMLFSSCVTEEKAPPGTWLHGTGTIPGAGAVDIDLLADEKEIVAWLRQGDSGPAIELRGYMNGHSFKMAATEAPETHADASGTGSGQFIIGAKSFPPSLSLTGGFNGNWSRISGKIAAGGADISAFAANLGKGPGPELASFPARLASDKGLKLEFDLIEPATGDTALQKTFRSLYFDGIPAQDWSQREMTSFSHDFSARLGERKGQVDTVEALWIHRMSVYARSRRLLTIIVQDFKSGPGGVTGWTRLTSFDLTDGSVPGMAGAFPEGNATGLGTALTAMVKSSYGLESATDLRDLGFYARKLEPSADLAIMPDRLEFLWQSGTVAPADLGTVRLSVARSELEDWISPSLPGR